MRPRRRLIATCTLLALASTSLRCNHLSLEFDRPAVRLRPGGLFVRPYLQLGDAPAPGALRVLWQAEDREADWVLEARADPSGRWSPAGRPTWRRVAPEGIVPHRVYRADLRGLEPGAAFAYRLRRGDAVVFAAEARAPAAPGRPHRFAIFGDCGAASPGERAIAEQAHRARPDLLVIPGDIAYTRGRAAEYHRKFWPVYDADVASPDVGAPLFRSSVVVGAPGNHDIAGRDLGAYPDGLAYFYYWDQPLNGPIGRVGDASSPTLFGPESARAAFLEAAGPAYPRMANFSFNFGGAHWTILDSNPYVDWTDPALRAWLARDLEAARGAAWRFVAMHHPPFNASRAHFGDQRLRVLADVFEAGRVDVVWAGHVHNYQRSYPLTFRVDRGPDGLPLRLGDRVPGRWTLDTQFDGRARTRPRGVIYVITGGGGADLYYPEQEDDPSSWQPFSCKLIARVHSLTVADLDGPTLTVRQLAADGQELDRFVVTRDPGTLGGAGSGP